MAVRTLENLLRDFEFSLRLLMKSPGFTVVALLTLVLGVGCEHCDLFFDQWIAAAAVAGASCGQAGGAGH